MRQRLMLLISAALLLGLVGTSALAQGDQDHDKMQGGKMHGMHGHMPHGKMKGHVMPIGRRHGHRPHGKMKGHMMRGHMAHGKMRGHMMHGKMSDHDKDKMSH